MGVFLDALELIASRLGVVLTFTTFAQFVLNQLFPKIQFIAQERRPFLTGDNVATILTNVTDASFGLHAIQTDIDTKLAALSSQITDLTNGTTPVSLPASPPSGYGYPGDPGIFNAVWNGLNGTDTDTPYSYLRKVGIEAFFRTGSAAFYTFDDQYVWSYPSYDEHGNVYPSYPLFDTWTILPGDNLLTWMTTQNPLMECSWNGGADGHVRVHDAINTGGNTWITKLDGPSFRALQLELFPDASLSKAPVWPGIPNVALGTPITITTEFTVDGPMDGILVELTAVPLRLGAFTFDTMTSYRNVGGFAFVSDNGQAERAQVLGFTESVYVPTSMAQADSCVFRTTGGVAGTVTPWLRTS
jgi:hypothetical protein